MNKERLLELARIVEENEAPIEGVSFDMNYTFCYFETKCRSYACMAGWALARWGGREGMPAAIGDLMRLRPDDIVRRAALILDVPIDEAMQLFYPPNATTSGDPYNANGKQAARVIRHFVGTGEVDWEKAWA